MLKDQSGLSAKERLDLAVKLSPGGAHTGGWYACELMDRWLHWNVDAGLFAAMIYSNWHGGKAGFQFLPDPATTDEGSYADAVEALLNCLEEGGSPETILIDDDRAFYDSLPDQLTVYRGCGGIDADMAAAGVCWTTDRDVAEWFAVRSADMSRGEPVVVMARIRKSRVRLAKASEKEVVTLPRRARQIKCRRASMEPRPDFDWQP